MSCSELYANPEPWPGVGGVGWSTDDVHILSVLQLSLVAESDITFEGQATYEVLRRQRTSISPSTDINSDVSPTPGQVFHNYNQQYLFETKIHLS